MEALDAAGRYQLLDKPVDCATGAVRRARDRLLEREAAIRFPKPGSLRPLLAEARAAARLSHPNVVTVHEIGDSPSGECLVMELIEGALLSRWRGDVETRLPQVAEGLAAAHRAGLVHRDLKPSNILIRSSGRVKIVDFGLARARHPAREETMTQAAAVVGTTACMAPEQRAGAGAAPHVLAVRCMRVRAPARRFEQAPALCREPEEREPFCPMLYYALFTAAFLMRDGHLLCEAAERGLRVQPYEEVLAMLRAVARVPAHGRETALEDLRQAWLRTGASDFAAHSGLCLLTRGRQEEIPRLAEAVLEKAARQRVNPLPAARVLSHGGKPQEAVAWLRRAMQQKQTHLYLLRFLALEKLTRLPECQPLLAQLPEEWMQPPVPATPPGGWEPSPHRCARQRAPDRARQRPLAHAQPRRACSGARRGPRPGVRFVFRIPFPDDEEERRRAVFFSITELEHHPILFDVLYQPGEIAFPEDLRQVGELAAKGRTELLRNTLGEIRIRGHVRARVEGVCDRCLEAAVVDVDTDFDLFYRPVVRTANHGEIHLEEGEIDLAFYEGEGVELAEALREQILLSLPMQLFCRPDCKGLCPYCGANRNVADCGCRPPFRDPRWASLKDLG